MLATPFIGVKLMGIISLGKTDIGKKRKTNQDSICVIPEHKLFVVADGMGGHNGGDIASQMSVELFSEALNSPYDTEDIPQFLNDTIININEAIYLHGKENKELEGMGTTISGVMFSDKFANIANIGDSRVYMLLDGMIFQLTRDHSLVQEKLNLNIYDRQGAKNDPQKNVLIRTLGFEPKVNVDIFKFRLIKNAIFMVCSDGLHGKVCDHDILKIMQVNIPDTSKVTQQQVNNAVNHLIQQANYNGGQDNISVIIAAVN